MKPIFAILLLTSSLLTGTAHALSLDALSEGDVLEAKSDVTCRVTILRKIGESLRLEISSGNGEIYQVDVKKPTPLAEPMDHWILKKTGQYGPTQIGTLDGERADFHDIFTLEHNPINGRINLLYEQYIFGAHTWTVKTYRIHCANLLLKK